MISPMKILRSAILILTLLLSGPVLAQSIDLRGVGLLDFENGGGCTGTLIKPDLVLTAGHCLMGQIDGVRIQPAQVTFHPATATGQPGPGFQAKLFAVHPVYLLPGLSFLKKVTRDIALVQLQDPVPLDIAAPIPARMSGNTTEKGFVISYRGAASIARQRACVLIAGAPEIITVGCEVKKGESGSPFLVVTDAGVFVAGVVSASSRQGRQPIALAVDLSMALPGLLEAFVQK